jgi:hypothetical protein
MRIRKVLLCYEPRCVTPCAGNLTEEISVRMPEIPIGLRILEIC